MAWVKVAPESVDTALVIALYQHAELEGHPLTHDCAWYSMWTSA